jgi:selenocysteine lyase/cysteine desulfurase
VDAPDVTHGKGAAWTEKIINAITAETAAVVISTIHWTYGTRFDLKQIGEKCKAMDARFIADGTQSVGALPIDVVACKLDALICAGYKWLLSPYSIGLAYYSEEFNSGVPIEDSWMNRSNAHDFTTLTQYASDYAPGAARYNVGEFSHPILMPMLGRALQQIQEWGVESVQQYCGQLIQPLLQFFKQQGYWFEENEYRANHLFGVLLPASFDKQSLFSELQHRNVFVSLRGDAIRISPHVYNDYADITILIDILKSYPS